MHALMNTHSTAGSHHSMLLSFVARFNDMLKFKALAMINQSHDRVVKAIFENMFRVLEEHKEASKDDHRVRCYNAEVRLALHLALLHLKISESKRL